MTDPRLKPTVVTLIGESEFSALVREIYGRPYQFQQQNFNGQDTLYRFTVPSNDVDDDWVSFEEWLAATPGTGPGEELRWEREFYPCFGDVVNDLHERGLIDAGRYALHIWW